MAKYKTPGVYIEEISSFPPSVAQVETAIPAFIGYTETGPGEPTRIESMVDYRTIFGGGSPELPDFTIDADGGIQSDDIVDTPEYKLYYMLEMFFANGGGPCFIISVGNYTDPVSKSDMENGLELLMKEDEPTLIVFPDAQSLDDVDEYHDLYDDALDQCNDRGDRFTIIDVRHGDSETDPVGAASETFRDGIGTKHLEYGAAYFPNLQTTLTHQYSEDEVNVGSLVLRHSDETLLEDPGKAEESLFHKDNGAQRDKYYEIKKRINSVKLTLPPSAAIAGVYAHTDSSRGVWKAPANVSLNRVSRPTVQIENREQEGLNISTTGKSINAIRFFTGKGTLVWGARTLDGNSGEWKYIPVRRFFTMVEVSAKKASEKFVFEPNDANTWIKVKAMIENYLTLQWRNGALMGAKTEDAFFVKVGLNETMSPQDILDGKMIVEIGMAAVRPAEFIILRFSHKMPES